jgi:hypothetical protein
VKTALKTSEAAAKLPASVFTAAPAPTMIGPAVATLVLEMKLFGSPSEPT